MGYKTDSIVIVGGGSAGWMTAATLIKAYPRKKITLVESDKIPTVGVGESTVSDISIWLDFLDVKPEDFMKFTNATFKAAIGFTNFYKEKSPTFYVPFGDGDHEASHFGDNDWFFKKAIYPDTPESNFCEYYYPAAHFANSGRVTKTDHPALQIYRPDRDMVYQIDASRFGLWLAEHYAIPKGVKRVIGTVKKVEGSKEEGITSLVLDDGSTIEGDLFIDCSGFKSLLLGTFMEVPFVSTKDILPNNKAWYGPVQYTDKEKELQTFTNCTALKNGWVWNTPLWTRIGTGYVYSDEFITDEEALEEFKAYLDSDAMVVHDPNRSKSMAFNQVQIKNGYYERFWEKNVVAIGLAGGFLEPLESTGLYFVHDFLLMLVDAIEREKVTEWDITSFNEVTRNRFERIAGFVAMHFALSQRDDSPYWKKLTSQKITNQRMLETAEAKYSQRHFSHWQFNCLAAGMNVNPINQRIIKEVLYAYRLDRKRELQIAIEYKENKIASWKKAIASFPTHYEYLKEHIYYDETE
jgi:tryptophan halogenase